MIYVVLPHLDIKCNLFDIIFKIFRKIIYEKIKIEKREKKLNIIKVMKEVRYVGLWNQSLK